MAKTTSGSIATASINVDLAGSDRRSLCIPPDYRRAQRRTTVSASASTGPSVHAADGSPDVIDASLGSRSGESRGSHVVHPIPEGTVGTVWFLWG